MDWITRFEALFPSKQQAARALIKEARGEAKKELGGIKAASLAVKIGYLFGDPGKVSRTWWVNRSAVGRLLAELVGATWEEILGDVGRSGGNLQFPEFPGLPSLDPTEEPCSLAGWGWLLHLAIGGLGPAERRLVVAPPGWGKSLVVRYLQARAHASFAAGTFRTLTDATDLAKSPLPVVLEIEETTDDDGRRFLEGRSGATVILTPIRPPNDAFTEGFGPRPTRGGWSVREVPRDSPWRDQLVHWVEHRIDSSTRETLFSAAEVRRWLAEQDPLCELVASPADLLALCADFDANGDEAASLEARACRHLRRACLKGLPPEAPAVWRESGAEVLLTGMVRTEFLNLVRGGMARSLPDWKSAMPPGLTIPSEAHRPAAEVELGYLRAAGLLRAADGGYGVSPTWMVHGLVDQVVREAVSDQAPLAWGLLAADASRRLMVDGALDRLADDAFRQSISRVLSRGEASGLALVGSVEALFASAARRLMRAGSRMPPGYVSDLQALATRQASLLGAPAGTTASSVPFTRRDRESWLADAWTISLRVPPPPGDLAKLEPWEFPGWFSRLDLSLLKHASFPVTGLLPRRATPDIRRLASLAPEAISRVVGQKVPDELPRLLLPAVIASAPERQWKLRGAHFHALQWFEWREVVRLVQGLPPNGREIVCELLWDLAGEPHPQETGEPVFGVAFRLSVLLRRSEDAGGRDMIDMVLGCLSQAAIERTVRDHGLIGSALEKDLPGLLALLPPKLLESAVRAWLKRPAELQTKWLEARTIAPHLSAGDQDLLLELVRAADEDTAAEFAQVLWADRPDLARAEADEALESNRASAKAWFATAPREELPGLADLMDRRKRRPGWLKEWAFNKALDAGPAAEAFYRWARSGN